MKHSKGDIILKSEANYIQCEKCGRQLNILNDYDFYDLNNCFEKECCDTLYVLTQKSYVLDMVKIHK